MKSKIMKMVSLALIALMAIPAIAFTGNGDVVQVEENYDLIVVEQAHGKMLEMDNVPVDEEFEIERKWPGDPTGTINAYNVNIRKGPGTTYGIKGTCNKGDTFTVIGSSGSWVKIEIGFLNHGWVHSQYIDY